ncbi:flavodoxin family protein [Streptomyces sp. NBC_01304]|uniref:flavodoxin family protein n=1 Tax=Streptomyces sp. NBC_01304 TaxID=2903818 RepID=UPI002E11551F|nr:NAD(P)H-dependent oxidoreductase [Streptomyces sp. NBC_01304]
MSRKFLFVLGSSRRGGNTELLARRAAEQLPADVHQTWLDLEELALPDFQDRRHDPGAVHAPPTGDAATLLDATLDATDVVLVSPLYWYSVSASTKRYLDHWSGWLRVREADFKQRMGGRRLWGVTVLAEEDVTVADPLVGTLRNTAAYMGMEFGGVLFGNGSRPDGVLLDTEALSRAKEFFVR